MWSKISIFCSQAAYVRISYKLRYRFATGFINNEDNAQNNSRRQLRGRRLHRTNVLLFSIAIIFCISWLPLNVYNLVADLSTSVDFRSQAMMVCYAVCHMMGMSSACSNPVLYGCLNENFWKEFKDILCIDSDAGGTVAECQKLTAAKKPSQRTSKEKPDLITVATDFNQGTTVSTEMSVLTKC